MAKNEKTAHGKRLTTAKRNYQKRIHFNA